MTTTSLLGHIMENEFEDSKKKWHSCDPGELLYRNISTINYTVCEKFKDIERTLQEVSFR